MSEPIFDTPEDNLTAATSLCQALAAAQDGPGLEDDQVFYDLAVVQRLVSGAREQIGERGLKQRRRSKVARAKP